MNVTEMWTTATSVPKRGCPLLVLDKVLRSEDYKYLYFETTTYKMYLETMILCLLVSE